MINCVYIGEEEFETFKTIIEEKNNPGKQVLTAIIPRIEVCYKQYLERFEELESKESSEFNEREGDQKKHLQGCYSSLTKTSKEIKSNIFTNQPTALKTFCPFCLLDKPKTLDHYVGQTKFPEYSFLVKNLIPCCYDCNQTKNEKWRENNRRRYIHFYNDDFLREQFLFADLSIVLNTPIIRFSLQKPENMSNENFQIVQWHFEDLALREQYTDRCNVLISSEIEIIKDSHIDGTSNDDIANQLLRRENKLAEIFGVNYWKSILYKSLRQNISSILSIP